MPECVYVVVYDERLVRLSKEPVLIERHQHMLV